MRNKILLIDSDVKLKSHFEEILESFLANGGELYIANALKTGIKIAQEEKPGLIFVCVQLKDFDQLLLTHLKGLVVLLSYEKLIETSYITLQKPVTKKQIVDLCNEAFKHPSFVPLPTM